MSQMKFGGIVTKDPREIPANAVRISILNNRGDGKDTEEYRAVYRACCTGEIPHNKCWKYKMTDNDKRGPIYADPDYFDKVIQAWRVKAEMVASSPQIQGRRNITSVLAPAAAVDRIADVLERLADAVENLATQPESHRHTPSRSHAHASTNGET